MSDGFDGRREGPEISGHVTDSRNLANISGAPGIMEEECVGWGRESLAFIIISSLTTTTSAAGLVRSEGMIVLLV